MKRVKLIVAYEGTNYCGWQVQNNGETIEGVLNRTLSELLKEEIVVIGASRTDAGVHAWGNIAVFDTHARMPAEKISFALNTRLPDEIKIQDSTEVPLDFHPRHCVSKKTYQYNILNRQFPLPTNRLTSYFYYRPLDIEAMQKAAAYLLGEHDFKSFCSAKAQVLTTVRTIYALSVKKEGEMITVQITGSGFLYNMVRIIVGTLIQAGLHLFEPEYIIKILEAKDRQAAGETAPACGLTLEKIEYQEN